MACGTLVPWPGSEPTPQDWKHGVLTTRPPGKFRNTASWWWRSQWCRGRRPRLTCVQRQVSGQRLLPPKYFPTHVTGEELVVEFPGGQPVSCLEDYLFCFWAKRTKAVWGINKAMETHFCLVNIQVNVQHSTFNLSQGLLLKKVAGELQATSGLHAPLLPLRRPFLKTVVVNGSQFQSSLPWFLSFLTKGLWTQPFSRLTAWLSTLLQIQQALYKRCWVSERLSCTLKFQKCRLLPVCVYRVTSVMSKSLQLHGL